MTSFGQCANDGRRRDVNNLEIDERQELNLLILDFLVSDPNPNWLDTGPDDQNIYNTYIEFKYMTVWEHTQFGDAAATLANHQGEQFLSWHREYIGKLEQYLLDQGYPQYVPLPAWDPNVAIPSEFYNEMIPEYLERGIDTNNNPDQPAGVATYLSQQSDTWGWGAFPIANDYCTGYDDAEDFGGFMAGSGIHVPVHYDMGGAMSSQEATSGTSAFWILHANIDEYYYCYQLDCQCPVVDVSGYSGSCSYCLDIGESTNATSHDVKLYDAMGNEVPVSLDGNGCIDFSGLTVNATYNIVVTAINDEMKDNIDCPLDQEIISFIVPTPPIKPCPGGITITPTSDAGMYIGGVEFLVSAGGGLGGVYTFYNTPPSTGTPSVVATNIAVTSTSEVSISIPSALLESGINYFTAEGNGEVVTYQYFIQ